MSECLRVCCKEVSCKIALMLERSCYSVACHGKFCQTVPVKPFQFKPKIAHVIRRKVTSDATRILPHTQPNSSHHPPGAVSYNVTLHQHQAPPGAYGGKAGDHRMTEARGREQSNQSETRNHVNNNNTHWNSSTSKFPYKVFEMSAGDKAEKGVQDPSELAFREFDRLDTLLNLSLIHRQRALDISKYLIDIGKTTIETGTRMVVIHSGNKTQNENSRNTAKIGRRLISAGEKIMARGEKVLKVVMHPSSAKPRRAHKPKIPTTRISEIEVVTPVIKMISLCSHGPSYYGVTLLGGFRAGHFVGHGRVDNMQACIKKCCANHECDLAFMVKEDCYSVICYHKSLCRSVRAQHIRKYKPRIAHIWRGSNEEKERVTSNVNSRTTSRVHIKSKGKGKLALVNRKDEESVTGNAKSRTTSRKHKKSTGKSKLASVYHPEQERVTGNAKSLTTSRKHMKSTVKNILKRHGKNKTTRAHHYKERVPEKHTSSKDVGSQISSSLSSTHSSIDENSRLNASFEERMTQKKYQKSSQASSERSATKDLATPVKSSEKDSQVSMKNSTKPANSTRQIQSLGSQEAKTAVHKDGFSENSPELDNSHSACPHSAIEHNVGLRRGLKTGKFSYIGEMFDIEKCLQVCCRDVDCDIAFMLDQSCYTVHCTNESMCHSVPYHQHQYSTKAVYVVRRFNKPKSRIGGIQRAANLTLSSKTTVSSKKGVAESSVVIGAATHGKDNLDLRHSRKEGRYCCTGYQCRGTPQRTQHSAKF
ncbi:hypothetical protein OS493_034672 [Desmophyllum pertusum]|uniref:MANSC domain-containing protein n=1 Tax=Desmophyllum pertusum TaxID=174260 RepID=A0A9W9ZM21_9CNID|nr:hypothetical protein OS493_034672 [Desmophyllum pertusum]